MRVTYQQSQVFNYSFVCIFGTWSLREADQSTDPFGIRQYDLAKKQNRIEFTFGYLLLAKGVVIRFI